jgi:hypothetical protein
MAVERKENNILPLEGMEGIDLKSGIDRDKLPIAAQITKRPYFLSMLYPPSQINLNFYKWYPIFK